MRCSCDHLNRGSEIRKTRRKKQAPGGQKPATRAVFPIFSTGIQPRPPPIVSYDSSNTEHYRHLGCLAIYSRHKLPNDSLLLRLTRHSTQAISSLFQEQRTEPTAVTAPGRSRFTESFTLRPSMSGYHPSSCLLSSHRSASPCIPCRG